VATVSEEVNGVPPGGITSPTIGTISAALAKAQAEVKEVVRNLTAHVQSEKANYNYKYAGLDEVYKATRDAAAKNGLSLFQRFADGGIHTILLHESGEWLDYGIYPLGTCSTHQQRGGAITYARRYVEGVVFKVAPEDDDDGVRGNEALGRQRRDDRPAKSAGSPAAKPPQQKKLDIRAWPLEKILKLIAAADKYEQLDMVVDGAVDGEAWISLDERGQIIDALRDRFKSLIEKKVADVPAITGPFKEKMKAHREKLDLEKQFDEAGAAWDEAAKQQEAAAT
jgi:hypothetical protein